MGVILSKIFQNPSKISEGAMARPGSPPRSLASIFNSQSTTNDFRNYLADLDKEEDDEEETRVTMMYFVIACRKLRELQTDDAVKLSERRRAVKQHVIDIGGRYFKGAKKVSLSNDALWKECQALCASKKVTEKTDFSLLWKAHDDVMSKLDDLHQPFLLEQHAKREGSPVAQMVQQCLL